MSETFYQAHTLCTVWCIRYSDCVDNCHCMLHCGGVFISNVSPLCLWHFTDVFQSWGGECGCSQDLSYCRVRLDWAGQVCLVWVCEELPTLYTVQLNSVIWFPSCKAQLQRQCVHVHVIICLLAMVVKHSPNGRMSLLFFFFFSLLLLEFWDIVLLPLPNWSHRYVIECKHCGVIFRSRQHWYGNPEPEQKAIKTENKHVWPEVRLVYCASWGVCWFML